MRLIGPDFNAAHLVHLKALTSLRTLHLTHTKVTGAGLELLFGLTKPQTLYHTHG